MQIPQAINFWYHVNPGRNFKSTSSVKIKIDEREVIATIKTVSGKCGIPNYDTLQEDWNESNFIAKYSAVKIPQPKIIWVC